MSSLLIDKKKRIVDLIKEAAVGSTTYPSCGAEIYSGEYEGGVS